MAKRKRVSAKDKQKLSQAAQDRLHELDHKTAGEAGAILINPKVWSKLRYSSQDGIHRELFLYLTSFLDEKGRVILEPPEMALLLKKKPEAVDEGLNVLEELKIVKTARHKSGKIVRRMSNDYVSVNSGFTFIFQAEKTVSL